MPSGDIACGRACVLGATITELCQRRGRCQAAAHRRVCQSGDPHGERERGRHSVAHATIPHLWVATTSSPPRAPAGAGAGAGAGACCSCFACGRPCQLCRDVLFVRCLSIQGLGLVVQKCCWGRARHAHRGEMRGRRRPQPGPLDPEALAMPRNTQHRMAAGISCCAV
eukprot:1735913-Rhodomonas_salina.1